MNRAWYVKTLHRDSPEMIGRSCDLTFLESIPQMKTTKSECQSIKDLPDYPSLRKLARQRSGNGVITTTAQQ